MGARKTGDGTKGRLWRALPPITNVEHKLSAGQRSAARPLHVLEFFDEIRRPACASEIGERLGFPQSTTSLLLNGMVTLGYLDYDPIDRSYQPSLRVPLLGSWRDRGLIRSGAFSTMLERLAAETGLYASLSSRNGIYLRYLHIVQQEGPGMPHMRLSALRYAVWSTTGMMLLVHLSDREIALLVRRTMAEDEPHARSIVRERIPEMLAAARRQGYFAETGLVTAHTRSISTYIPADISGCGVPLGLTLSRGAPELGDTDEAIAAVMNAAIAKLAGGTRHFRTPR